MIVVEGIYSMGGDTTPMAEIAAVKREYGGYLLVDEAHSMGVMGATGRGAAQAAGVDDDVDFYVGTFSKSLGAIGGYCASKHALLEAVRFSARPYIFTASASPSVIASARAALQIVLDEPERRQRLWDNARHLYSALEQLGLDLGPTPSPVIAITLQDRLEAINCWNSLLHDGIYVNLVVPPASPSVHSLLRCSVSAAHSPAQVDRIIAGYTMLVEQGLISSGLKNKD
jgi:8-amino-7-oxononanoate synthase